MNTALMKSKIVAYGETQADLAKQLGISLAALNAKIRGHYQFKPNEIAEIKRRYSLTPEDVSAIFFDHQVSDLETSNREDSE